MKKIIYILSIITILQTAALTYLVKESSIQNTKTLQKVTHIMEYNQFKEEAIAKLGAPEDLLPFAAPGGQFFQTILADPYSYLDLMKQLIADKSVHYETKLGASATMIALDIKDLALFVDHIITISKELPEIYDLAITVAENGYRYTSFKGDKVSHQVLSHHVNKSYVAQVFRNYYNHPLMTNKRRKELIEGLEDSPILAQIITETLQ